MQGRALLLVALVASPSVLAEQPSKTGQAQAPLRSNSSCVLQSQSPAWLANRPLTDGLRMPPLSEHCEQSSQQQPGNPSLTPTGMPGPYYPDPVLQRDYMMMVRPR